MVSVLRRPPPRCDLSAPSREPIGTLRLLDLLPMAEPSSAVHPYAWDHVPQEVRSLFGARIPHEEKLRFMCEAIAAGRRSPFRPAVGAVIVRDGRVLARGCRDSIVVESACAPPRTRSRHAEEVALLAASEGLEGATLYTTLEPCFDRATPGFAELQPCCTLLVRSGIGTVVIGLIDHDPRTLGRGAGYLARHGVGLEFAYGGLEPQLFALIGDGRFWHGPPGRGGLHRLLSRVARAVRLRA